MISKLVAWAEDRPRAIARMRRALGEYVVAGIRTTVPFFTWLLDQPAFVDGLVHTTFLDEVLRSRQGRPFAEPTPHFEEVAVMAAALQSLLSPPVAGGPVSSTWKRQARIEGLNRLERLEGLPSVAVRN
jgi:acetyl-CoA carboxylase biotin carboxylase subunit